MDIDSQPAPPLLGMAPVDTARAVWSARLFFGVLATVCAITAFNGLPPIVIFGHDTFVFLDNAYRVLEGQVPHRDFQSAFGPITFLMDALGLRLSGLRPDGLAYASAIFGALVSIWAWLVARRRVSPPAACVIGIYTLLLIVAPFSMGYGPLNFSHAMAYNRYGFALIGIVLVECLSDSPDSHDAVGAWSTGMAVALLGFLKVSFAVVAVPVILLAGGANLFRRKRLLAICGGGAAITLLVLLYLRFEIAAMLGDLAMAASGRGRSWHPREIFLFGFGHPSESVPLLLLALAVGKSRLRWFVTALATLTLAGFLLSTNHQPDTLVLNGFVAVLMADRFIRHNRAARKTVEGLVVAVLAWACIAPFTFQNCVSIAAAAREKLHPSYASLPRLDSARGASMVFTISPFETETGGPRYVVVVNDGLALLRRHTGPHDGTLVIDGNPFNYLLDRPSPLGGFAAGGYNYVFSDARHPSPERWAGNTRYVLVRKYDRAVKDYDIESYHLEGMRRIYQPFLDQHFHVLEETPHWILYARR